jgi:uncharacterized protein (DUF885 family)
MLNDGLSLVAEQQGYGKITNLRQFFEDIETDPQNKFQNENETIKFMNDTVQKIKSKLGMAFDGDLLNLKGMFDLDVVKGPANRLSFASYKEPSPDGKRKGIFNLLC